MTEQRSDVVVIGGGLVGLCFALLLAAGRRQLSVTVVESVAPLPPAAGVVGLRVSAISPGSRAILAAAGVWQQLPPERIGPYRRMRVWQATGAVSPLIFDAAEMAEPELGYVVENDLLRYCAWQALAKLPAVTLLQGAPPTTLTKGTDGWVLGFADGATLIAQLLVGADGTGSWTRQQLGVECQTVDHQQRALVAHVSSQVPHAGTAFQRFLTDGPVALLPLADGRSSVVWSRTVAQAGELEQCAAQIFVDRLEAATEGVLGHLQLTSERRSFPLTSAHADRYTGAGWALLGDAAHQVHPLAGQGVNLGLLDAEVLADELHKHLIIPEADPGDPLVLRRFERRRKGDNLISLAFMDALNRLFSEGGSSAAALGGVGLGMVNRLVPLKHRLARHALGLAARQSPKPH